MRVMLPTVVEVQINDVDLLTILKNKRADMLAGAEYAEQDEESSEFWLWKINDGALGKPDYQKFKEITQEQFELLDSITRTVYLLQKEIEQSSQE